MSELEQRFVFVNDSMNFAVVEATAKAKELELKSIGVITTPRDTDDSTTLWLLNDYDVNLYTVSESLDAVMGHRIVIIDEDLAKPAILNVLGRYAEIISE